MKQKSYMAYKMSHMDYKTASRDELETLFTNQLIRINRILNHTISYRREYYGADDPDYVQAVKQQAVIKDILSHREHVLSGPQKKLARKLKAKYGMNNEELKNSPYWQQVLDT